MDATKFNPLADTPRLTQTAVSRRAFVGAAAAAGAACALPAGRIAWADEAPANEIVIFHTNDTHGYLQGDGDSCVGIDLVAGLHAAMPNSLLLDAGDISQGSPLASLSRGVSPFELFNAAGYDAACLGNHEFDYGLDTLLANVERAQFPVLGANVTYRETGEALLAGVGCSGNGRWTVLECARRRIGVFGLTTTATPESTTPSNVAELVFAEELAVAEECIVALAEQGVDAIVALTHMGDIADVPLMLPDMVALLDPELAKLLTVVIDGHSHTVENDLVNGVLVVQTAGHLTGVGQIVLTFAQDGSVQASAELFDPAAVAALGVLPEPATAEALQAAVAEHEEYLSTELAPNPTTLWGGYLRSGDIAVPARIVQTNLGSFACDAYLDAGAAYLREAGLEHLPLVAVQNGGGVRASLPRGVVTVGDCVAVYPFGNSVQLKTITPAVLYAAMEAAFEVCDGQDAATGMLLQEGVNGNFNQVGGFSVAVDPSAELGARVVELRLDGAGEPLDRADDQTPIVLISNSYVMAGGGHPALAEPPVMADLGGDLDVLVAYVEKCAAANGGALPSMPGGVERMSFCGGYEPAPWTAYVRLVDAEGEPLHATQALVQVDGADVQLATSDSQGLLAVQLSDGPHAIALVAAGEGCEAAEPPALGAPFDEAYVNNYMGIGLIEDALRTWPELKAI